MKTFAEVKKDKNLSSTNFPFTIVSLRILNWLRSIMIVSVFISVIYFLINHYTYFFFYQPTIDNYAKLVLKAFYGLVTSLAVLYLILVVKRQRLYERSVIKNDLKALKLKKDIIKKMNLRVDIQRANEVIERAKKQENVDNQSTIAKAEIELEAYEVLEDMTVTINRRETTDNLVETVYNIFVESPESTAASTLAKKIADERIPEAAKKATGGTFFSDRRINNIETDEFFFQARADVTENQWNYEKEIADLQTLKDSTYYQHTMPYRPLTVDDVTYQGFTDNSQTNAERREKALEWAKGKVDELERILANEELGTKFNSVEIMSRTAEYDFIIPNLKLRGNAKTEKFNEVSDILDETFDCNGTRITSKQNNLHVSLPLPNGKSRDGSKTTVDFCMLMNNEDFFRKAFG